MQMLCTKPLKKSGMLSIASPEFMLTQQDDCSKDHVQPEF